MDVEVAEFFSYEIPQNAMATSDAARAAEMEELRQIAREATANVAALTAQLARLAPGAAPAAPRKKPDLPPFDPKNIEIWVQRIEAAYTRHGIASAKDKFAFLESQFPVNFSAKINSFLFNPAPTDASWQDFIIHLIDRYGPTRRQRAEKFTVDFPRGGRTPSEFLAFMDETGKDVTFDDVKKEHLMKSLPARIREYLGKDADDMTAQQVADKADAYFDKEGRLLESPTGHINAVSDKPAMPAPITRCQPPSAAFTTTFEDVDEEEAVHHVSKNTPAPKRPPHPHPQQQRRPTASSSTSGSNGASGSNWRNNPGPTPDQRSTGRERLCRYHYRWDDNAQNCTTTCPRFKQFMSKKQQQQGNAKGSR